jgi:cyclin A
MSSNEERKKRTLRPKDLNRGYQPAPNSNSESTCRTNNHPRSILGRIALKNPQELVDEFNQLLGTYADDVHQTQKQDEERHWNKRNWNCFDIVQNEITEQMRSILIDWLTEVTEEYGLCLNTLFLTVDYIDRILEVLQVPRSKLQLLGVSCMLVASKFEEIHPPLVDDFVYITDNTYCREEILKMELICLNTLKFSLTVSTIKNFLTRFLLISEVRDYRIMHHTHYLAELTLPDFSLQKKYKPSLIAAAITCISKAAFNLPACLPVFEVYSGYLKSELIPCIQHIYFLHARISQAKLGDLTSAREKYKADKYGAVSLLPLSTDIFRM